MPLSCWSWCDPVSRLPGAPITKRRVQHKPHECLNPTSVSKQRCRDSCGLSSSFVGARYGKNRITRPTNRCPKKVTRLRRSKLNPEIKRDVVSCLYESEFQARTASLNSKDNLRAWFQELGGRKLIPRVQTFVIRLSVLRCSCGPDFQNESHIIEGLYSKNIFYKI